MLGIALGPIFIGVNLMSKKYFNLLIISVLAILYANDDEPDERGISLWFSYLQLAVRSHLAEILATYGLNGLFVKLI